MMQALDSNSRTQRARRQSGLMLVGLVVAVGIIGTVGGLLTTSIFQFSRSSSANGAHNEVSEQANRATRWLTRDIRKHASTDLPDSGVSSTASFSFLDPSSGATTCSYSLSGTDLIRNCDGAATIAGNNIENLEFSRSGSSIVVSFDAVSKSRTDIREEFDLTLSSDVSPIAVNRLALLPDLPESSFIPMERIDFETDGHGDPLNPGDVIAEQWANHGIHVSIENTSGLDAMIFGSTNPTGGDADLGTPHEDFGGKGKGHGGGTGQPAPNDTALDNLLIISEDGDSSDPDDAASGGTIVFTFDTPVSICSVGMIDAEEQFGTIETLDSSGERISLKSILPLGDNSVQDVMFDDHAVSELRINLAGSGGVVDIDFSC